MWKAIVVIVIILILASFDDAHGMDLYKAVMCHSDWKITVSQRYDDRDRWGWIVKRTWITRCY